MIAVVYGTTGELIKLAPLMREIAARDQLLTLCTAQQPEQIPGMLDEFGLPRPDLWLADGHAGEDLDRPSEIPAWGSRVVSSLARRGRGFIREHARMVLVHGDTFTTVIGAASGRAAGRPVGHIEAGLRSGDWRNPFPEELNRRITSRIARYHYSPGPWAVDNLRRARVRGEIIDTGANTVRDALKLAASRARLAVDVPADRFGVVSIHRFELLRDRAALEGIMALLASASEDAPLLFVDHPVTVAALRDAGLDELLDAPGITRIPRQGYLAFVALLGRASFLVTDSGGSQEECAALGLPCVVHRARTERRDGLDGGPVLLSGMDLSVVEDFLRKPPQSSEITADSVRPTDLIVRHLEVRGMLDAGPQGRH